MPRQDLIQYRRGTAAQWKSVNPVLAAGEVGFATDKNEIRIGNGVDAWSSLEPIGQAEAAVPPILANVTVEDTSADPRFVDYFDGYMWGALNGDIYRSADEGVTWTLYCNSWPGVGDEAFISRIVPTADGEVLVLSNHELRKSSGWANGNAATWSASKVPVTGTGIFNGFGFDGDGQKFIIVEYSPVEASWSDSRYGYISTDAGTTFIQGYDSNAVIGPAANALSHLHGACYDPISDRFYIGEGHGPGGGVYHSVDDGATWAVAPGMRLSEPGGNYNAPTVITATKDGLVMGSDNTLNGLFGVLREDDPMDEVAVQTVAISTGRPGLVMFAQRGWLDEASGLVYVTFRAEYSDTRPAIAAGTATTGGVVYEWPTLPSVAGVDRFYVAAVTGPNRLTAYAEISGVPQTVRGQLIVAQFDTGNVSGGRALNAGAIALGPGSSSDGVNSIAAGRGADTGEADDALAFGAEAKVTANAGSALGVAAQAGNAGTSVGRGALSHAESTAVGFGAKCDYNPYGTAVGTLAKANFFSSAFGHGADASGHVRSVALGATTVTTAADQVQMGARHIELAEIADPAAPAANAGRIYFRDNGSGKTQLVVVFPSGTAQVIATEP